MDDDRSDSYVDARRGGLVGERHATRTRELSFEHGSDTKCAMHALRIAHQGASCSAPGGITLPIAERERTRLLEVRRGELPLRCLLDRLREQSALLEDKVLSSDLPDEPDPLGGRRVPCGRLSARLVGRARQHGLTGQPAGLISTQRGRVDPRRGCFG